MIKVQQTQKAFCDLPFTKLILNGWGDVSMCCYQLTQLGSIYKSDLLDLWNSPTAQAIREDTKKGTLHPNCTSWNTCPFQVAEKVSFSFPVTSYPTYLEICLPNTHCNIGGEDPNDDNPACIMCCRNYDLQKQPNITDLLCQKAKFLIPHLRFLCVLGVAEPFWKDAVFKVFKKLDFSKYKHRITFTTNTNVTCLTEKVIRRFFEEVTYSDISFSIDAASPETYQKIRRIDAYNVIISNLKNYMKLRGYNHKTSIYNNINLINVHEMVKMVEVAAILGVDKMIMLPTHDQCGRVQMGELILNASNQKLFKTYSEKAKARAEQLGVNLVYSHPFDISPLHFASKSVE